MRLRSRLEKLEAQAAAHGARRVIVVWDGDAEAEAQAAAARPTDLIIRVEYVDQAAPTDGPRLDWR
jgi:hypothetical protein